MHAGLKIPHAERLCDVVVGPEFQRKHLIRLGVFSDDDDYAGIGPVASLFRPCAPALQPREPTILPRRRSWSRANDERRINGT